MLRSNRLMWCGATCLAALIVSPVHAESCADLWYQRNLIYAQNGFCFSTSLGQRMFSEYECWTKNPQLSAHEQRRVDAIRAEERRRGCKVNN